MKYCSTRGRHQGLRFEDAVMSGFLADSSIVMPEVIPKITQEQLRAWAEASYQEILTDVVTMFVDESELSRADVESALNRAFKRYDHPEITPIMRLGQDLNIIELFHGPTLSFKDLALGCLGQVLEILLQRKKKHITVIVGTSGDTGSAALEGVRGMDCLDMIILMPRDHCSRVQGLQMTTVIADNVHIYKVEGTSDDTDVAQKNCFKDADFRDKYHLSSMNSINWGRILFQTAHYIYAYVKMCPSLDQEVEIVVPSGALGNVTGGCIARAMGLPIRIVCAVNANDTVARTLRHGDYSLNATHTHTWANAMDIQEPYNMERLMYLFSGGDTELVKSLMDEHDSSGKVTVPEDLLAKMRPALSSHVASDADIIETMQRCWKEQQYLLCPHTAVGVHYHYNTPRTDPNCPRVIIATASPAKFEEAVLAAGLTPPVTPAVTKLSSLPEKFEEMTKGEDWEAIVRKKVEEISAKRH